jgi:hypothetical protein
MSGVPMYCILMLSSILKWQRINVKATLDGLKNPISDNEHVTGPYLNRKMTNNLLKRAMRVQVVRND